MPDETVLDGEVVALDHEGRPSFNVLQNYGSSSAPLFYYVFDVMVLVAKLKDPVRISPHLNASLDDLIASVKALLRRLQEARLPGIWGRRGAL
jgi:hypothetical protein